MKRSQLRQGRGPSTAAAPGSADCAEDDDDAFYLFSQEHKVDRAGLPTARETGLHHHLRSGDGAGLERPDGLSWDEVPVRILRLPQERIAPQAKAAILAPLTALWLEESTDWCVEVCPLCEAVRGPLMDTVMKCVEEADLLADLSWRRDLGVDVLRSVLLRFEGLAGPLGNNEGVPLEGLSAPFSMGDGVLFVNRMTELDGSSLNSGSPEITKPGGVWLHLDKHLLSMANRLMELWKMAAKTQAIYRPCQAPHTHPHYPQQAHGQMPQSNVHVKTSIQHPHTRRGQIAHADAPAYFG